MQQTRPVRPRSKAAFTLIELLTVIAIIGILAAIIIPTVSKVRQSAKNAQCVAQLREWGRVIQLYANDNKGRYYTKNWASIADADAPGGVSYKGFFTKANEEGYRMRLCPSDPNTTVILTSANHNANPTYGMIRGSINGAIGTVASETAIPLHKAKNPSQYLLMMDAVSNANIGFTANDAGSFNSYIVPLTNGSPDHNERHGGKMINAVFGDGSIKRITYTATRPNDPTAIQTMRTTWFQLY